MQPTRVETFKSCHPCHKGEKMRLCLPSPIFGPMDAIRLRGNVRVEMVMVGMTCWSDETEARRVLDPLAQLNRIHEAMFHEERRDGVTYIGLPIDRERGSKRSLGPHFTHPAGWVSPAIPVFLEVVALEDGTIEAELDVLPDPVLAKPIGRLKLTLSTDDFRELKIEEVALELERFAFFLRSKRPIEGSGELSIQHGESSVKIQRIGVWSLDPLIERKN